MSNISEKRGVRLTGMAIEELINLLQRNHLSEEFRKVKKITIEVEYSAWTGYTCSVRDLLNPKPTDTYTVEFDDTVDLYRNSKEDLKDMYFNNKIIP